MNRQERVSTLALGGIFALRMIGFFMIIPVFAVYGQDYIGATPALIGLALGIYGLAQALMQIPVSILSDRFPRKPIIVGGLLVFAVGAAICALSDHIWGVIAGRFIAGAGAISSVVMALLADVTREESRGKAMAFMGMLIALSFIVAFSIGPILMPLIHLSGLFWLTAMSAILAIGLLQLVPTPVRSTIQFSESYPVQLGRVMGQPNLNRIHLSSFFIHLFMAATFVLVPNELIKVGHIPVSKHGWVYLPMLLTGFMLAVPAIVMAEKYRKMRMMLLSAVLLIAVALGLLAFFNLYLAGLIIGLTLFFIGFNMMEALLPSWLSKVASVKDRATAMGVNATSQFLGAFVGGSLGGILFGANNYDWAWGILAIFGLIWLLLLWPISSPPYLTSLAIALPDVTSANASNIATQLQALQSVEDVVVLPQEKTAYLKLDKKTLTHDERQALAQIVGHNIVF